MALLEKMADFFEARIDGYDEHMLNCIMGADEFYRFTAGCLPRESKARILDLGCGTGLELEEYFEINPGAQVVGIDISAGMLSALKKKFPKRDITLICGSYFDIPFEKNSFSAAISVESLHHFTKEEKLSLYKKLRTALKDDGYFILTDYFADSEEEELLHRNTLISLKRTEGITDGGFYHYDTPLTADHECEVLLEAGFSTVEILASWERTKTIKAIK